MQVLSLIILFAFQTEKLFTFVKTNPLEYTETENKYQYCNKFGSVRDNLNEFKQHWLNEEGEKRSE